MTFTTFFHALFELIGVHGLCVEGCRAMSVVFTLTLLLLLLLLTADQWSDSVNPLEYITMSKQLLGEAKLAASKGAFVTADDPVIVPAKASEHKDDDLAHSGGTGLTPPTEIHAGVICRSMQRTCGTADKANCPTGMFAGTPSPLPPAVSPPPASDANAADGAMDKKLKGKKSKDRGDVRPPQVKEVPTPVAAPLEPKASDESLPKPKKKRVKPPPPPSEGKDDCV